MSKSKKPKSVLNGDIPKLKSSTIEKHQVNVDDTVLLSALKSKINNLKQESDKLKCLNYLTEARKICVQGIHDHKTFPDFMKEEAIEIIQAHFASLGKSIAAIELTHLRYIQHNDKAK